MAGGSIVRVGHVRRSASGHGPLLLSNIGGRNSICSAVCACGGKASCRRRELIRVGRTRSCYQRGSASATATTIYMSSVETSRFAREAMRFFTKANGFTSIALRSQWTRKSSWKDLAARSSILSNAAAAPIGRGGKKLSIRFAKRRVTIRRSGNQGLTRLADCEAPPRGR